MAIIGDLAQKKFSRKGVGGRKQGTTQREGFNGHLNMGLRTVGKSYAAILHQNKSNNKNSPSKRMPVIKTAKARECLGCSQASAKLDDPNPSRTLVASEVSG